MYPSCVFVLGDLGCRKTTVFLWGRGRRILGSICRANEYNNIKAASLKSFKKGFQAAPEERVIFQDIQALVQPRVSYQSSPPPAPHVNSNLLGMNSFLSWDLAQLQLHLGMWSSLILDCKTFSVHRGQKKQRKEKLPKKESLLADLSFFQQEVVDYHLHCDLHLVLKSFRKLGTSHMVTHFSKQTNKHNNNSKMLAKFCSQRVSHFCFWWCYTQRSDETIATL